MCVCLLACWHILVLTFENTGNFFFWELVPIAMLAGVVGLLGTQFIRATVAVNRFRAKYYLKNKYIRVFEALMVGCTAPPIDHRKSRMNLPLTPSHPLALCFFYLMLCACACEPMLSDVQKVTFITASFMYWLPAFFPCTFISDGDVSVVPHIAYLCPEVRIHSCFTYPDQVAASRQVALVYLQ